MKIKTLMETNSNIKIIFNFLKYLTYVIIYNILLSYYLQNIRHILKAHKQFY